MKKNNNNSKSNHKPMMEGNTIIGDKSNTEVTIPKTENIHVNNYESVLSNLEELVGQLRNISNYSDLVNGIIKKKNVKNSIDIIVNFLNNVKFLKKAVESNKKLKNSLFSKLIEQNGDIIFLKEFFSFIEEKSINQENYRHLLNSIHQKKDKLTNIDDSILERFQRREIYFINCFRSINNYDDLMRSIMKREDIIIHFLEFLGKIEEIKKSKDESLIGTIFEDIFSLEKNKFVELLITSFKKIIFSIKYERKFVHCLIEKLKISPKNVKVLFDDLNLEVRFKIDTFLDTINHSSIEEYVKYLLADINKINMAIDFFLNIDIFTINYEEGMFRKSIFECIFKDKGKFAILFLETIFKPNFLIKENIHNLEILYGKLIEIQLFKEKLQEIKKEFFTNNKQIVEFLEKINSKKYEVVSSNIMMKIIEDSNKKCFETFLNLIDNYKVLFITEQNFHGSAFYDIIRYDKNHFLGQLFINLLGKMKGFTDSSWICNLIDFNFDNKIKKEMDEILNKHKKEKRDHFREIFIKLLTNEIDIYFLISFIEEQDFEIISLLTNKLIKNCRYEEAFILIKRFGFSNRIDIENGLEQELIYQLNLLYNKNPIKKRKKDLLDSSVITFVDDDSDDDSLINDNHNSDSDSSDEEVDEKKGKKNKMINLQKIPPKNKSIIDYFDKYIYKKPYQNKFDFKCFNNLLTNIPFFDDMFGPIYTGINLNEIFARENIIYIDSIISLRAIIPSLKKLGIDFEYVKNTMCLIQIADKERIYLIDYYKLIYFDEFYPTFEETFKGRKFICFDYDSDDKNLLGEKFVSFFENNIEDIKKRYGKIYPSAKCPSLSDLCLLYLDKQLCKYYQCSNWARRPLLKGQIHYAALDSYVLLELDKILETKEKEVLEEEQNCSLYKTIRQTKNKDRDLLTDMQEFAKKQLKFIRMEKGAEEGKNEYLIENSFYRDIEKICICAKFLKRKNDRIIFEIKTEVEITSGDLIGIYELLPNEKLNLVMKTDVYSNQYNILKLVPYKKVFEIPSRFVLIQLIASAPYKTVERIMGKVKKGQVGNYCKGVLNIGLERKSNIPTIEKVEFDKEVKKLYHPIEINSSQLDVINHCLNDKNDVVLIHGPPGTGKTHTLVELIIQYAKNKKKILVTGFSNTAVNHIAESLNRINKFYKLGVRLLRSGRADKSMISIKDIDMNTLIEKNPQGIAIKYVDENIHFMDPEDQYHVKKRVMRLNGKIKNFMSIMYEKSDVILMTCATSGNRTLSEYLSNKKKWFDLVIIDEASQALESSCWSSIILGKRLVISGDHHQLPPVIKSKENVDELSYTLFEKLIKRYKDKLSLMLLVQYRMAQSIMEYSSRNFYEGKLKAHESVASKTLINIFGGDYYKDINKEMISNFDELRIFNKNLIFFDTSFWNYKEETLTTSKFNIGEATIVKFFIDYLLTNYIRSEDIGVITPYAGQVDFIKSIIDGSEVEVSSVDGYQGREKEVIIISFVRSNDKFLTGFLNDYRRLNVSLTRAKKMIIIICDSNNFSKENILSEMVKFYKENSFLLANESFSSKFKEILDKSYLKMGSLFMDKKSKRLAKNLKKIAKNKPTKIGDKNNNSTPSFQDDYSQIYFEDEIHDCHYKVQFKEYSDNMSNMSDWDIPSIHY